MTRDRTIRSMTTAGTTTPPVRAVLPGGCIGYVRDGRGILGPGCPDLLFATVKVVCDAGEVYEGPVCRMHWVPLKLGTVDVHGHRLRIVTDVPVDEPQCDNPVHRSEPFASSSTMACGDCPTCRARGAGL